MPSITGYRTRFSIRLAQDWRAERGVSDSTETGRPSTRERIIAMSRTGLPQPARWTTAYRPLRIRWLSLFAAARHELAGLPSSVSRPEIPRLGQVLTDEDHIDAPRPRGCNLLDEVQNVGRRLDIDEQHLRERSGFRHWLSCRHTQFGMDRASWLLNADVRRGRRDYAIPREGNAARSHEFTFIGSPIRQYTIERRCNHRGRPASPPIAAHSPLVRLNAAGTFLPEMAIMRDSHLAPGIVAASRSRTTS